MRGKLKKDYWIIKFLGQFDKAYYLKQYPDVRKADLDPIEHYVLYGWKEGRNPKPSFDTKTYLENNPDVAQAGINPFKHWIIWGRKEGRKIIENNISSANGYKKIIEKLVFQGIRGCHYYKLVMKGIRIIRNEGWKRFWVKFKQWMIRRKKQLENNQPSNNLYEKWIAKNEPKLYELNLQRKESVSFPYRPKISIVMFVWNPKVEWLSAVIKSVANQTYYVWELCLIVSNFSGQNLQSSLSKYAQKEWHDKVKILHIEEGISTNIKEILSITDGEYVGFLDQKYELAPFALYEIVKLLNEKPETDFIYSDEDKISENGHYRFDPKFKPDFSPDTLRSYNYIGHFFVTKSKLAYLIDGNIQISSFDGGDVYDLVLQLTERANKIFHIPKILCHKREVFTELFTTFDTVRETEYRNKILHTTGLITTHNDNKKFKFSLIILSKNKPEYIIPLLEELLKGNIDDYYEVIVGDTGTDDVKVIEYYRTISQKIKVVRNLKYHFSANYNFLITSIAQGEIVGIINNDIILPNMFFLEEIENIFMTDKDAGIVGTKLLYPDGRLQHGGIFFMEHSGINTGLPYHRLHRGDPRDLPKLKLQRIPAVTGAFMFCRKNEFITVNGFDEIYKEEAQDIDLCLKFRRMCKNILFANIDGIIHLENGTREKGSENWDDRNYFLWKWRSFLEATILGTELNREFEG